MIKQQIKQEKTIQKASEIKCLKQKNYCLQSAGSAQQEETGPRPANTTRLGFWPGSQWLGRPNGPALPSSWAVFSPHGC
jgi:hypothetical protein